MNKTYKLVNHKQENRLTKTFKNSILGMDIGFKNEGIASIITLSTILAVGTLFVMYFMFRI